MKTKVQMQKVFVIRNKETKEIAILGTEAAPVKAEWDNYFAGTEDEGNYELQQTFVSQNEIRKEMNF